MSLVERAMSLVEPSAHTRRRWMSRVFPCKSISNRFKSYPTTFTVCANLSPKVEGYHGLTRAGALHTPARRRVPLS